MTARMLLPVLSLATATLVACLPWRGSVETQLVAPFLPVVIVCLAAARRPRWLPEWSVALAGLAVDTMTLSPMGFWALVYLVAFGAGLLARRFAGGGLPVRVLATGLAVLACAAAAALGLALYGWGNLDARPLIVAAVAGFAFAALLEALLGADAPAGALIGEA